jgi:hypothetical protein
MTARSVIVRNLIPVTGNKVVGLVDLYIPPGAGWSFCFRRCPWLIDGGGERLIAAWGIPFEFQTADDGPAFQRLGIAGARELIANRGKEIVP